MLVLARKVGERIRIGSDIFVTVTRIGTDKVGLGFEAPDHVEIVRTELDEEEHDARHEAD